MNDQNFRKRETRGIVLIKNPIFRICIEHKIEKMSNESILFELGMYLRFTTLKKQILRIIYVLSMGCVRSCHSI